MKKAIFLFLVVILSIVTSSCKKAPIKIGFVAGLSGRKSELGIRSRNSAILAVKNINQDGGINGRLLELVISDNKDKPSTISKIFTNFKQANIHFVVGPLLSKMALETVKAATKENILVLSPTISTTLISNLDDNFIRFIPTVAIQGSSITEKMQSDGVKRIAVVYDSSNKEYTEQVFNHFKINLKNKNLKIVYTNSMDNKASLSFQKIANNIAANNADALYVITSGIDAALISQQVKKKNAKIKLYGANWAQTIDVIKNGGKAVEGMTFYTHYQEPTKLKKFQNRNKEFKKHFQMEFDFISVYTYEAFETLAYALRKTNSNEISKIKNAIIQKKNFEGFEEKFAINKFGDCIRSKTFVKIENENFVIIK